MWTGVHCHVIFKMDRTLWISCNAVTKMNIWKRIWRIVLTKVSAEMWKKKTLLPKWPRGGICGVFVTELSVWRWKRRLIMRTVCVGTACSHDQWLGEFFYLKGFRSRTLGVLIVKKKEGVGGERRRERGKMKYSIKERLNVSEKT